jgi:ABC-type multidrug transport system ATPase subunit
VTAGTALRARGIVKRFGSRTVLDDVTVQVAAGEVVVLRGPNGSGKSTLIGCICGTVIPDDGTVEIAGHDLVTAPLRARAALRYLPQEVEVPPGLTGHEVLRFYADVFDDPPGADRAAAFTGLGEALGRLATTYSVGMRRLLGFATVLPGKAALWVLDEPFAGLDVDARARLREALQTARADGCGIVLAAHDRDAPELEALDARPVELQRPAET